jgi:hypothetical protein
MHVFAQKPGAVQLPESGKWAAPGRAGKVENQAARRPSEISTVNGPYSSVDRAECLDHDFSQVPIRPSASWAMRMKPLISQPGDSYERAADHVSEYVMRMPEPQHESICTCGGNCSGRQCGYDHEQLQMKPASTASSGQVTAWQGAHHLPNSPGEPLDASTRGFMEPRFGHDFSQVRVHTDARAADSAKAIRARAYTAGYDVFFAASQFSPVSTEGKKLLAHELSHVLQQSKGATGLQREPERDDDEEPAVKGPRPVRSSLLSDDPNVGGGRKLMTDKDLDPASLLRTLPTTQAELNEEAMRLGEKQGKRRLFMDAMDKYSHYEIDNIFLRNKSFLKEMVDLDMFWDSHKQSFNRIPEIDALESEVDDNAEAHDIYNRAYDHALDTPAEKSWFDDVIGFVCKYTNPCHNTMEQIHKDVAGGMSVEDARARGLFSTVLFGMEMTIAPGQPEDLQISGEKGGPAFGLPSGHSEIQESAPGADPNVTGSTSKPPMQMAGSKVTSKSAPEPAAAGETPGAPTKSNIPAEGDQQIPQTPKDLASTRAQQPPRQSAVGKGAKAWQAWPKTNTAAGRLPRFSGRGQPFVADALRTAGFKEVSPNEWIHPDGSKVRIDPPHSPEGNPGEPYYHPKSAPEAPYRSHSEPHYHKEWRNPRTQESYVLDDAGYINPDRSQTHIIGH